MCRAAADVQEVQAMESTSQFAETTEKVWQIVFVFVVSPFHYFHMKLT
jgi:hypothetical protein